MIDLSPEYLSTVKSILQQLVPEYEVRVFGSRYKWLATTSSDLDLAIVGTDKLSEGLLSNLQDAFADSDLPFKVDVLDWNSLSDEFKAVVEQGYEVLQKPSKKLPEGWTVARLGDVAKINGGKRLPKGANLVSYKTVHPYIRITDLEDNHIKKEQLKFITDHTFSSISKYIVNSGDIILSIVGSVGFVAKIDNDLDNASLTENCVKLVQLTNLESGFLYYFLISKYGQNEIMQNRVGAVQKKLPIYGVQNIKIRIPPLHQQQSIAAILSSLDNLIELNTAINKKLEEIAQAIFKQWFIDFNFPDENGNSYKDSGGEMIDSEMGLIPRGWRVGVITEIIKREVITYKCTQIDIDYQGKIPIIDQGSTGLYGYTSRNPDFIATKDNPVILFTNHTCNYWFVDYSFCAIQNVIPYRGAKGYDEYFIYFLTKDSVKFIEYKGHWADFVNKNFIIPRTCLASEFSRLIRPILWQISENDMIMNNLVKIRDALLPKLINGDIILKKTD